MLEQAFNKPRLDKPLATNLPICQSVNTALLILDYINHLKVGRDNRGVMRPMTTLQTVITLVVVNYANLYY